MNINFIMNVIMLAIGSGLAAPTPTIAVGIYFIGFSILCGIREAGKG